MSTTGDPVCKRCGCYLIASPGPLCSRCDRAAVFDWRPPQIDAPLPAAPTPAAGPWIRVDSGERPEDGEEVIVVDMRASSVGYNIKSIDCVTYFESSDTWEDDCGGTYAAHAWTHFARVRLPGERRQKSPPP